MRNSVYKQIDLNYSKIGTKFRVKSRVPSQPTPQMSQQAVEGGGGENSLRHETNEKRLPQAGLSGSCFLVWKKGKKSVYGASLTSFFVIHVNL